MSVCLIEAAGLGGCTLLTDLSVHACESDADCNEMDDGVMRCEQARCVPGCVDNRQCSSIDPRLPVCQHPGGACVGLTTEGPECYASSSYDDASMGALTGQDLILVGAFAPTLASSTWLTLQLATDELNSGGGLPGPGRKRPVVVVLCDSLRAGDAVTHLVGRLEVQAILASLDDESLRAAIAQLGDRHSTLFLSPYGSSTRPSTLGSGASPLWYLGAEYQDAVAAYGALLRRIMASTDARRGATQLTRVAAIIGSSVEDQRLAASVRRLPEISDIDVAGVERNGRFRVYDLFGDSTLEPAAELQRIAEFAPDVVMLFAGGVFAPTGSNGTPVRQQSASVLRALDAAAQGFQPFYVLGPRNIEDSAPRRLASDSASFRAHGIGLQVRRAVDETVAASVRTRFDGDFPEAVAPSLGLSAELSTYDALYYLAYAVAAAPWSSAAIEDGLLAVTDPQAERVDVGPGPEGLDKAVALLVAREHFNLYGTTGEASFDLQQQARPGPSRLYCWDELGKVNELAEYSAETGDLEATEQACSQELASVIQR